MRPPLDPLAAEIGRRRATDSPPPLQGIFAVFVCIWGIWFGFPDDFFSK